MADIIIKRKITLEFLGKDYEGDYLVFKAVPVSEHEVLMDQIDPLPEGATQDQIRESNKEATKLMVRCLEEKFIEGRFQNQDVKKEDMGEFDGGTVNKCFALLTGQDADPKE